MCLLALSHCCSCLSEVLLEIHFKIKLLRHRTTQWFIQQGFSCVIKCTSYPDIPWSSFLSWSDLDKTMLKFRRTGCWHQLFLDDLFRQQSHREKPVGLQSVALSSRQIWDLHRCSLSEGKKSNMLWESCICTPHTLKYLWRNFVYDSVTKISEVAGGELK